MYRPVGITGSYLTIQAIWVNVYPSMKKESGRVTITMLAKDLGLSVCTINKAMTGKPRISEDTRLRVQKAAARLGYQPNRLARTMARPMLTIGVIRPDTWPTHTELLVQGIRERLNELRDHRVIGDFRHVHGFRNGLGFVKEVENLASLGANGFIVMLGNYSPAHRRKIWKALDATRAPAVLLGEAQERGATLSCITHDCHRCGRMAAEMLGTMVKPKPIAIFVGQRDVPDHRDKIAGFEAEARRQGMPVSGVAEALDDPEEAFPAAARLFKNHPDTAGIYIGSENAAGILRYMREHKLAGKVRVIATGNSHDVTNGIEQGTIHASLYQNQPEQGRRAVEILFHYLETFERPTERILIAPAVLLRNNIDLWPRAPLYDLYAESTR